MCSENSAPEGKNTKTAELPRPFLVFSWSHRAVEHETPEIQKMPRPLFSTLTSLAVGLGSKSNPAHRSFTPEPGPPAFPGGNSATTVRNQLRFDSQGICYHRHQHSFKHTVDRWSRQRTCSGSANVYGYDYCQRRLRQYVEFSDDTYRGRVGDRSKGVPGE